ncbi:MAG: hypothetical protein AB7K04_04355 [Pseudorhodoplanes sp.]
MLTLHERRWFGAVCENCDRDWQERFRRWSGGLSDELFDFAYGEPTRLPRRK